MSTDRVIELHLRERLCGTRTFTATDKDNPTLTKTTSIQVTPGVPILTFKLTLIDSATWTYKGVITVADKFGNIVADYTGSVHFICNDPGAILPGNGGYYTFKPADQGKLKFNTALQPGFALAVTLSSSI